MKLNDVQKTEEGYEDVDQFWEASGAVWGMRGVCGATGGQALLLNGPAEHLPDLQTSPRIYFLHTSHTNRAELDDAKQLCK